MPPTAEAGGGIGGAENGNRLADYDYFLPEARIALRPASPRDSARLLTRSATGALADRRVRDLPDILRPGDRLVVNDSRVVPAQLSGVRLRGDADGSPAGARVGLTLISMVGANVWDAMARPAKRLRAGDRVCLEGGGSGEDGRGIIAEVIARDGPEVRLSFDGDPLTVGAPPLPPYIAGKRAADAQDVTDYQTVYAETAGSVAAPTAGLHFTHDLLSRLKSSGISVTRITLHVGPGTFLPVSTEVIAEHTMHAEWGEVSAEAVDEITGTRTSGGRIVVVGTTALRLLESAAKHGTLAPWRGETDIFIRPGFRFHVADVLMTNFHLPRSTLLMLVAAFIGFDEMKRLYRHALDGPYRFFSYGDAALLTRADGP